METRTAEEIVIYSLPLRIGWAPFIFSPSPFLFLRNM